jgi:Cell division protein FtsI/penicillin-binding protein 2
VAEIRAIAHVARVSVRHVSKLIVDRRIHNDLLDPIVVRTEATRPMQTYLEERATDFPGLTLARSYIRRYPNGSVAAQLLGYDGQNTHSAGEVIGLTGIEAAFNTFLSGVPGEARVSVDSLGRPRSQRLLTTSPEIGQTVRLTINARLQVAAQNALGTGSSSLATRVNGPPTAARSSHSTRRMGPSSPSPRPRRTTRRSTAVVSPTGSSPRRG